MWSIERSDRLGEEVLVAQSGDGTARAVVANSGATLLSWELQRDREVLELTDGYRDRAELLEQSGVRNGVLAPFPNRVADGRYRFDGQDHDLLPGVHGDRTVYHGFARTLPFTVESATAASDYAQLVLRTDEIRPGRFDGYPFALDLTVTYTIEIDQITLEIHAVNTGTTTAPYAAGWHPYFQLGTGTGIDELELRVPSGILIRTDDALIPTNGPDCRIDLDGLPEMDFRGGSPIGDRVIDACYADLRYEVDGHAETTLRDPKTGRGLRIWQTSGFMHIFTGDTLPRDRRGSVAIEPVEVMTNAYNRPEFASALALEPGRERRFRCGVRFTDT